MSPYASLWTLLALPRKQVGKIVVRGVSTAGDAAARQFDDFLAALGEGTVAASNREQARMSWLEFALNPFPDLFAMPPGGVSIKVKDALLKRRLTDRQIDVAYDYLTSADHDVMGGMLGMASYGGAINRVAPDATASAQRDAILDLAVQRRLARSARRGEEPRLGARRSIATCSRTAAACPFPATRTRARSSITPTSISRIRR